MGHSEKTQAVRADLIRTVVGVQSEGQANGNVVLENL